MFTGIVLTLGTLQALEKKEFPVLRMSAQLPGELKLGDSVAVNGACLTIIQMAGSEYSFNLSQETLKMSNFLDLSRGSVLNLELPLTLKDFLGGHMVSGHLDGVVRVKSIQKRAGGTKFSFVFNKSDWRKFLIPKGSVTLNGVSLTLSEVGSSFFSVEVIPHTLDATNLKLLKVGDRVNLELDLIGKYLYNFK
jgi:riboflavin synthase